MLKEYNIRLGKIETEHDLIFELKNPSKKEKYVYYKNTDYGNIFKIAVEAETDFDAWTKADELLRNIYGVERSDLFEMMCVMWT